MKKVFLFLFLVSSMLVLDSCSAVRTVGQVLNQINLFTVEQDKELGNQLYLQIQEAPNDYPLLDPVKYATAYTHIRRIMKTIMDTEAVAYADEFEWTINIIDSDVLNAFAAPGGKIYVYKGLIDYLDNEAQLAGVIAHEMGHVACRHSTRQMTKQYGIQYLSDLVLGKNASQYLQLAASLAGNVGSLAFSRSDEYEADACAVAYLSYTDYNPLGIAGFFEKMLADGNAGGSSIKWLSTHPSPPDRIDNIYATWELYGSEQGNDFVDRYKQVKASLK